MPIDKQKIAGLLLFFATIMPIDHACANSLINNSATGVVQGSVVQSGNSSVYVGAITYDKGDVQNINVFAVVKGDIKASPGTRISVGSYHGK